MTNNQNLAPNQGDEGAELRIGVVKPATKTAPAMRLSVNDAEILASATERYGTKDLEAFRKLLHEQRAEASEEFDILSEQMLDTSGEFDSDNQTFSLHTAEQGTDAMEREKTFLHAQRTSDYIKKLDEALARIDRGTYGICVVCGKLIEKPRLQAVPITQKHVDCKNKTQQKKISTDQSFRDFPEAESTD
jgi:DnaK suppressor protein